MTTPNFDAVLIVNKRHEIATGPFEPKPSVLSKSDASSHSITFNEEDRPYPDIIPSYFTCFTD